MFVWQITIEFGLSPQIRFAIRNKEQSSQPISLPFDYNCKSIAALFYILYPCPIWGGFVDLASIDNRYILKLTIYA